MDEQTTRSLSKRLEQVRTAAGADEFISETEEVRAGSLRAFLNKVMVEHSMNVADVVAASGVNKNYVYNIYNGVRKNPSRDRLIALCIGSRMTFSETNHALEIAGLAPLYPKDERDVRIAVAINQQVYDVTEVNLQLENYGLEVLNI